jgi:hypothetical protein
MGGQIHAVSIKNEEPAAALLARLPAGSISRCLI